MGPLFISVTVQPLLPIRIGRARSKAEDTYHLYWLLSSCSKSKLTSSQILPLTGWEYLHACTGKVSQALFSTKIQW